MKFKNVLAAIKEQLLPVGSIIEWCPVDGGPDLSTPDKVAAYYGFGQWEAFGAGRMLLGQSASHAVGSTGGEETHLLTRDEIPNIGGAISFHGPPNAGTPVGAVAGDFKSTSTVSGKYLPGGQQAGASSVGGISFSVGGGQTHNNMPPYITVYRWRRTA